MKRLVLVLMISFILAFNIQLNNNNFKNFENKKHVFLIQENQKENEIIEKEAKEIVARAKRTLRRNVYEDAFELVFKIENNDLKNELLIELKQILQLIEIREKRYKMVLNIITFIWIIGLISLVIVNNRKKRKNLETIEFEVDYFRELPSELPPEKVYYLLYKKVDNRTMKSCVLELIRKKVLLIKNENNKYILEKNKNYNIKKLSYTESLLLSLVVEKIGNGCYISSENSIYKFLDFDRNNRIVTSYNNWKKMLLAIVKKKIFFVKIINIESY